MMIHTTHNQSERYFCLYTACRAVYRRGCVCCRKLLILFVVLFPIISYSQNNIYKIDDELYGIYNRAYKNRGNDLGIAIADTMRMLSVAKGDKKAECLAHVLYLHCSSVRDDDERFVKAVEDVKQVSRRNNYPQYYYHAVNLYIARLLNSGRSIQAIEENAKIKKEAFEREEHYGILSCIRNMARIQSSRGDNELSYKYWLEALEYQTQYVSEQEFSTTYLELAKLARQMSYLDKAMEYNKKGFDCAVSKSAKAKFMQQRCHILYKLGRFDEFEECFNEALRLEKEAHILDSSLESLYMRMCERMIKNDTEGAIAYARKLPRIDEQLSWMAQIYSEVGEFEKAYDALSRQLKVHDSLLGVLQASDIAEMNTQVGNQLLRNELAAKEREAMQLKLAKAQQEIEMEQQHVVNEHLKLNNQELELNRLKSDKLLVDAENDRQRAVLAQDKNRAIYQSRMMMFGIVASVVLLMVLMVALMRHRIMLERLNQKNKELEVARDQADSANKIKTIFIQNLSHEIRTPLNSIVGFSQVITEPGMDLAPEEMADYVQLIQHNSELLTTLVNDLLGLAELESGKYTISKQPVHCNQMCNEAISTVMHRKPEGVDLRYSSDVDDSLMLNTDARRVKQVLINYLTNAEKHTTDGYIELRCSLHDNPGKVTFSVTDTGVGIAPEHVDRVFERFEKLNYFETGFGLGLSICRAVADRLNGMVRLDTSYTNGARFLFIIPYEKVAMAAT